MAAKIDEKSILAYFESFHEKHTRRYKSICDNYASLIKQNIQSRTPSKEVVDENVSNRHPTRSTKRSNFLVNKNSTHEKFIRSSYRKSQIFIVNFRIYHILFNVGW